MCPQILRDFVQKVKPKFHIDFRINTFICVCYTVQFILCYFIQLFEMQEHIFGGTKTS